MHKFGIKEVLYEGVNTGEKDYSAIVSKIKESGADYLMWGGLHTEGGLIVRQMRDQGMKTIMISGDGITDNEFAQIGGPGVEGTLMSFGPDPRNNPTAKEVVAEFKAKNFDPEAYTLYSYAAVQIMKQAAEKAKSLDPKKVAEAMHSGMTFHTVIGPIAYDKKGDRTDGRLRLVRLEERRRRQDQLQADVIQTTPAETPGWRSRTSGSFRLRDEARRRRRVFLGGAACSLRKGTVLPNRFALIAAIALAAAAWPVASGAQSSNAGPQKVPMHPSTLTLRGGRHPPRTVGNHRYHNHVHNTFNQRPHIHGTMAGPRM